MRSVFGTWLRIAAVVAALTTFPAVPATLGERPQRGPRATQTLTSSTVMPVVIEIAASCAVSASDLDFGAYPSNSPTPALGQTAIQLQCGAGITAEVLLDAGTTGIGGNTSRRQLAQDSGIDRLDYGLYQDPGRTVHWGDNSGRDTREVLTTGAMQTVTVYGEIPAGQRVRDGTYSDMITVRVKF
jgi:spore coat protein U-like protein